MNDYVTKIEKVKAFLNNDYANAYYSKQNALDYKNVKCINNLVIFEMKDDYLKEYEGLLRIDIMFSMLEADYEYIE